MTSSLRRSSRAVSLCDRFRFSSQRRLCVLLTTILRPSVPSEPSSLGVLDPPSTGARIVARRFAPSQHTPACGLRLSARSGPWPSLVGTHGAKRRADQLAKRFYLFANLAAVDEPRGFLTVANAKDLVGGAQVLLYRRLGEEEALGDLCVAQPLGDEMQYLPLADGERVEIHRVIVRYEVLEKLPGGDDLALVDHLHGAGYLIQLHTGVYETPGSVSQGGPGERQIHVQAEDQNGDVGVDPPDAFYALGDSLGATRVVYGATGNVCVSRSGLSNVYPRPTLQCLLEAGGQNGIRAIYPDKPQTLTLAVHQCRLSLEDPAGRTHVSGCGRALFCILPKNVRVLMPWVSPTSRSTLAQALVLC